MRQEINDFLSENKEEIYGRYLAHRSGQLTRDFIEEKGLMTSFLKMKRPLKSYRQILKRQRLKALRKNQLDLVILSCDIFLAVYKSRYFLALIVLQCFDHAFLLFANHTADQIDVFFAM